MEATFIGIDGGGTRTTAVATDREGRVLARVHGGAALVDSADPAAGAAALADLAERALRAAGLAPPATALCCALAGAGRPDDRLAIAAALHREAIAERIRVVTDADAAFHDAFADGPGILLIAGTGSIALGRNHGAIERIGGWGSLLGDEGSGYAIGLAALRAAVRAHDGRGPVTTLLPQLLDHFGLGAPDHLVPWCAGAAKGDIAALAPPTLAAAEEGDPVASAIVESAARDLVDHIAALTRRLAPWRSDPVIALAGGLIAPDGPLRARLVRALEEEFANRGARALQPAGTPPHTAETSIREVRPRILPDAVDAARGAAALARESTSTPPHLPTA